MLSLSRSHAAAPAVDDHLQQVNEDQDIDSQQADANPGETPKNLDHLQRQERRGDGQREEFAPRLLEIKANAFSERDGGVAICHKTDAPKDRVVDERGFLKDEVDEARLGIEAKVMSEQHDLVGNVFVEQAMRAHADGDKQEGMEKLVKRDKEEPAVMVLAP